MSEKALRTKMINYINDLEVPSRARQCHGGPHSGSVGEPDIDAVVDGVPLKLEVKLPGNRPTRLQAKVIDDWAAAGAVAGWTDSMEGLEVYIEECMRRRVSDERRR